jgi:thiol-disulfide isomerase/thioredoxin
MFMRIIFYIIPLLLMGCTSSVTNDSGAPLADASNWIGYMQVGTDSIPFRFVFNDSLITIKNGEEEIRLNCVSNQADTLVFPFPQYNSVLLIYTNNKDVITGLWDNYSKGDYKIPFNAYRSNSVALSPSEQPERYQVVFSPDKPSDEHNAIGLFYRDNEDGLTGTFLTESGDYRFLEGQQINNEFWLSCFDGAHLFLFKGAFVNDSVQGTFLSGNHWSENWVGVKNSDAHLIHADSLTVMSTPKEDPFRFTVCDFNSDTITFGPEHYKDKVTIVQLFGSWCPNCYDELVLYGELNSLIADSRLQVIQVAFERSDNLNNAEQSVSKLFSHANVSFKPYFGGKASKDNASMVFNQLSPITSFPTSIIIGKDGIVKKIHTGFYGPGTGLYYDNYKTELKALLLALLAE